jgi:hypothetical protein
MDKAVLQCQLSLEAGASLRIINGAGVRRLEHDGLAIASALQRSKLTVSASRRGRLAQFFAAAARFVAPRADPRLDARVLRDIGLESYHPQLAQRMREERQAAARLRSAPLGLL